jgi:hypothetical protein
MTASTRSKLMFCLVVGLIALPAEALLLPIARTPDAVVAATEWTATLDESELREAAANIEAYPAVYRKTIMGRLDPADRASAWRAVFHNYLASNPSLSADQVAVIREAAALSTADAFVAPVSPEMKTRIGDVFARAQATLGKGTATELFVTLGPREPRRANALPLAQKLANRVRSWTVASAQGDPDPPGCNCNIEIDTCDYIWEPRFACSELYTCEFDLDWPMCGPFWSWACTGWCKALFGPTTEGGN